MNIKGKIVTLRAVELEDLFSRKVRLLNGEIIMKKMENIHALFLWDVSNYQFH